VSTVLQPRNSIENVYHWSCGYRLTMGLPVMGSFDVFCFYLSTVLMPLAIRVFHIYIGRFFFNCFWWHSDNDPLFQVNANFCSIVQGGVINIVQFPRCVLGQPRVVRDAKKSVIFT